LIRVGLGLAVRHDGHEILIVHRARTLLENRPVDLGTLCSDVHVAEIVEKEHAGRLGVGQQLGRLAT
jgi:hypothetical protein